MKRGTPTHPKTRVLARLLGLEPWGAVGVLESLWHFAGQYARRGDIGRHSDIAIAEAIGWSGNPDEFVQALTSAGWLEACSCHRLKVHDWPEHADQAVHKTKDVAKGGFLECYRKDSPSPEVLHPSARSPLPRDTVMVAEVYPLPTHGTGLTAQDSRLTATEREAYAKDIWAAWLKRRGRGGPEMSTAEWDWLLKLMDAQVPLRIVLQGIADCGGKLDPQKPLLYAKPAVEVEVVRWRRGMSA